ncbi:Hypothetical protein KVN_LOCUS217 [uncultured virus]|nr:Hypothetical protein KVN_LOCUS217 [uncultured virus]
MESIFFKKNFNDNPIHIDPIDLLWVVNNQPSYFFSPKADGIFKEIIINNKIFLAEYMIDLNLYLVFDTKSYPVKHNNNYESRIKWIQMIHGFCKDSYNIIKKEQDLLKYQTNHNNNLNNYLLNSDSKIKWYPKIIYKFDLKSDKLLYILDGNINNNLLYKTDGWIITPFKKTLNFLNIYKYKNKTNLTVDLLFFENEWFTNENIKINIQNNFDCKQMLNNHIYRCYWENGWVPKEKRIDKKLPNNLNLVNKLEYNHNNYWTVTDLISTLDNYYYDNINNNLKTDHIKKYLNYQKEFFKQNLSEIIKKDFIILDFGCGKGKIIPILESLIKDNKFTYVGIDNDPKNIYIAKNRYKYNNLYWIWADMNNKDFEINDKFKQQLPNFKYDLVIFNNSLHYLKDLNFLFDKLMEIIGQNFLLYLHFFDKESITFHIENLIEYHKEINIMENGIVSFELPWFKKKINEKIISSTFLDNYFKEKKCLKIKQFEVNKINCFGNLDFLKNLHKTYLINCLHFKI